MQTFVAIKESEPFPYPQIIPPVDGCRNLPGLSGFNSLLVMLTNPTDEEITQFRHSPWEYGLFCQESIPYLVVRNGSFFGDASFNVVGAEDNKTRMNITNWLNDEGNILSFVLIDRQTKIIKCIRSIGLHPTIPQKIREACRRQLEIYPSYADISKVMTKIESQNDTSLMIKRSLMYRAK